MMKKMLFMQLMLVLALIYGHSVQASGNFKRNFIESEDANRQGSSKRQCLNNSVDRSSTAISIANAQSVNTLLPTFWEADDAIDLNSTIYPDITHYSNATYKHIVKVDNDNDSDSEYEHNFSSPVHDNDEGCIFCRQSMCDNQNACDTCLAGFRDWLVKKFYNNEVLKTMYNNSTVLKSHLINSAEEIIAQHDATAAINQNNCAGYTLYPEGQKIEFTGQGWPGFYIGNMNGFHTWVSGDIAEYESLNDYFKNGACDLMEYVMSTIEENIPWNIETQKTDGKLVDLNTTKIQGSFARREP